jgi:rSAM/selenodomain-associated transferase 2
MTQLSIIIPVLNEAQYLANTLVGLPSEVEKIVVDGGSQDDSIAVAQAAQAIALSSPRGRAIQMNRGAAIATGDHLLFLHADTQLPQNFAQIIPAILEQPTVIAGAFELKIEADLPGIRVVEWGTNLRSRLFQLPYGDQGIFLKRKTFEAIGGFPEQPIMEDFELMQRLKQKGKIAIASEKVITAGRRWQKLGVLRTTWINQKIILAYWLGVSPAELRQWY